MKSTAATLSEIDKKSQKLLISIKKDLSRLESIELPSTGTCSPNSRTTAGKRFLDLSSSINMDIAQIRCLCADMKRKVEQVLEEVEFLEKSKDGQFHRYVAMTIVEDARLLGLYDDDTLTYELSDDDNTHGSLGLSDDDTHELGLPNDGTNELGLCDDDTHEFGLSNDDDTNDIVMESACNSSKFFHIIVAEFNWKACSSISLSKIVFKLHLIQVQRAQRKALDVLNTLGLSGSKWIVYGGMIMVIIVSHTLWRWIH